jgi:hypothetical protein
MPSFFGITLKLEIISLNLIEQTKRLYQQNKITRQITLFYKIFANLKKT